MEERRVPKLAEMQNPEKIIGEIDPNLTYTGKGFPSIANLLYVVRDLAGEEKVIKIAATPDVLRGTPNEHTVLDILNRADVIGIPRVFRFYNSVGSEYDPKKLVAVLREYVSGERFNAKLRTRETYEKLLDLANEMGVHGVSIPNDFNDSNVIVDEKDQPYIIDLEESGLIVEPVEPLEPENSVIRDLWRSNVQSRLSKSENHILRLAGRFPIAVDIAAALY